MRSIHIVFYAQIGEAIEAQRFALHNLFTTLALNVYLNHELWKAGTFQ